MLVKDRKLSATPTSFSFGSGPPRGSVRDENVNNNRTGKKSIHTLLRPNYNVLNQYNVLITLIYHQYSVLYTLMGHQYKVIDLVSYFPRHRRVDTSTQRGR